MTRDQILDNPSLLKRFCRDYNVPVSTYAGYYFTHQLETLTLYNPDYMDYWNKFCEELSHYNSAEDYFEYYNSTKDSVIRYITENEEFKTFSNLTFSKNMFMKHELYTPDNDGKCFVSIDMRKANFTIVNLFCKDLFQGKSWEEFLKSFGCSDYLAKSKYLRQVIFGACNPKKQIQAQTEFMDHLALALANKGFTPYSVVTDEIIYECSNYADWQRLYDAIHYCRNKMLGNNFLKISKFTLNKNNIGYNKKIEYSDDADEIGKIIFKCVDSDFMCQYIKYFYNMPIKEYDMVFDYKGKVAEFETPIRNPFID